MLIDDLPTPCLLIEQSRMDRNLAAMQERARTNRVRLRPHIKTHKSIDLGRRQQAAGASGITVATVTEAEVFSRAGFDDIRIAVPVVGRDRLQRIADLAPASRVSCVVDTTEGARAVSDFFSSIGQKADVLVEVDTGHHRTGVPWSQRSSVDFISHVATLPGLHLLGLLTHAGQAYHGPRTDETPAEALVRAAQEERDRLLDVAGRLAEAGLISTGQPDFEISIGSTPSLYAFSNKRRHGFSITEIRPGNYIFNDAMQVALGSALMEECALTVLATVISRHRDPDGTERVFIDAGKKVLTTDTGYGTHGFGTLLYNAAAMRILPHADVYNLSEEHGWIRVPGGATLLLGDRVRIIPNHACVTVHTQEGLYLVDGDEVVGTVHVDARSRPF